MLFCVWLRVLIQIKFEFEFENGIKLVHPEYFCCCTVITPQKRIVQTNN